MIAGDKAAEIWACVTQALVAEITDWDLAGPMPITETTTLKGDLGLDSLAMVRVITAIERALGRRDLPFERLLVSGGHYVDDVSMTDMIGFLAECVK